MAFDEHTGGTAHPDPDAMGEPPAGTKPGSGLIGRRGPLASAAVALTAVASAAGTRAAHADAAAPAKETPRPAEPGFDQELWDRQHMLSDLRDWIENLPGIGTSGYVASINDPDAGSTVLVWHGPADRIQRQIMDEARRRHIPISIQQRRYRRDTLDQAVKHLITIGSGTGVFQNFEVSALVGFDVDFDGITVMGDYLRPPAEGVPAADSALARALTAMTGVAVSIDHTKIDLL